MPKAPTDPRTLAGRSEIQDITGLSRQRVHQLVHEDGFPAPVDVLADGRTPVWRRLDIEEWWKAQKTGA